MPAAVNNASMVLLWDVHTRSGLLSCCIVKIRDSQWLESMWDLYERGNCSSGAPATEDLGAGANWPSWCDFQQPWGLVPGWWEIAKGERTRKETMCALQKDEISYIKANMLIFLTDKIFLFIIGGFCVGAYHLFLSYFVLNYRNRDCWFWVTILILETRFIRNIKLFEQHWQVQNCFFHSSYPHMENREQNCASSVPRTDPITFNK